LVDVGTMEINGSINTTDIDSGIVRIEGALKVVETQAKQTQGSFDKLGISTVAIGSALGNIATKGVTAISGLASKSPMLGSSFAKMDVELLKVSNTLGSQIKPIFDEVANNLIPSLNEALASSDTVIGSFVDLAKTGISDVSNLISGNIDDVDKLTEKMVLAGLLGTAGGLLGGKVGATAGATAGYSLAEDISLDGLGAELTGAGIGLVAGGLLGGPLGAGVGAAVGTGAGRLIEWIWESVDDAIDNFGSKQTSYATANGTSLGD